MEPASHAFTWTSLAERDNERMSQAEREFQRRSTVWPWIRPITLIWQKRSMPVKMGLSALPRGAWRSFVKFHCSISFVTCHSRYVAVLPANTLLSSSFLSWLLWRCSWQYPFPCLPYYLFQRYNLLFYHGECWFHHSGSFHPWTPQWPDAKDSDQRCHRLPCPASPVIQCSTKGAVTPPRPSPGRAWQGPSPRFLARDKTDKGECCVERRTSCPGLGGPESWNYWTHRQKDGRECPELQCLDVHGRLRGWVCSKVVS